MIGFNAPRKLSRRTLMLTAGIFLIAATEVAVAKGGNSGGGMRGPAFGPNSGAHVGMTSHESKHDRDRGDMYSDRHKHKNHDKYGQVQAPGSRHLRDEHDSSHHQSKSETCRRSSSGEQPRPRRSRSSSGRKCCWPRPGNDHSRSPQWCRWKTGRSRKLKWSRYGYSTCYWCRSAESRSSSKTRTFWGYRANRCLGWRPLIARV